MSGLDEDVWLVIEVLLFVVILWYWWFGFGLFVGVFDVDLSNVVVYVQVGSQFGFNMLWMIVVMLLMMVVVQFVLVFIGCINCEGFVVGICEMFFECFVKGLIVMVVIVNVVNVGVDFVVMGDVMVFVVGGCSYWYVLVYGLVLFVLQVLMFYECYVCWFKWMMFGLFVYVIEFGFVYVDWGNLLYVIVLLYILFMYDYVMIVVVVFGMMLSFYLFVWQVVFEVEEIQVECCNGDMLCVLGVCCEIEQCIMFDMWIGMVVINVVLFCIMVIGVVVFFVYGWYDIGSIVQVVEVLWLIVGEVVFLVFVFGIVGCGLFVIFVFVGSVVYGCVEVWWFCEGLNELVWCVFVFYMVLVLCVIVGIVICFSLIDLICVLYWSVVFNGVVVVLMFVLVMLFV